MLKLLKNPLYIYVFAFLITFLVYRLGWSALYPDLTNELKLFFSITFLVFIAIGLLVGTLKLIGAKPAKTSISIISTFFYLIMSFYILEFLYEQDFPLFAKLAGRAGIDYDEFGIPLLHGILISLNSFMIAHSFAVYMSIKKRKAFIYYLLLYLPALLILNRSIIVFGLMASLFIYIHFLGKVNLGNQIKLGVLALICLYFFGVVGNFRSGGEYIYTQSEATEEFMESNIPKEYYWSYLYIASPLANFQNTVDKEIVTNYDFTGFIFYETFPKIISKNLGESFGVEKRDLVRIVPWLTVGTTYAKSYAYIGWLGPYLLFVFNLMAYMLVLFLVPKRSSYHVTTIAILSVIVLLNIFTNMLIVTGISFQLVYCILFAFFERKTFVLRKK